MATSQREHWLRGPVANVPDLLQPVAHALLQAKDEINEMMKNDSFIFLARNGMDF